MSRKNHKNFGKCCPECGYYTFEKVIHHTKYSGVVYDEEFMECCECGYKVRIKQSGKHKPVEKESE